MLCFLRGIQNRHLPMFGVAVVEMETLRKIAESADAPPILVLTVVQQNGGRKLMKTGLQLHRRPAAAVRRRPR